MTCEPTETDPPAHAGSTTGNGDPAPVEGEPIGVEP
jgi:hypothetical protein